MRHSAVAVQVQQNRSKQSGLPAARRSNQRHRTATNFTVPIEHQSALSALEPIRALPNISTKGLYASPSAFLSLYFRLTLPGSGFRRLFDVDFVDDATCYSRPPSRRYSTSPFKYHALSYISTRQRIRGLVYFLPITRLESRQTLTVFRTRSFIP